MGLTDAGRETRDGNGPDALLVDAEPTVARLFASTLEDRSVSLELVADGEAAVERLTASDVDERVPARPALLVLDVAGSKKTETALLDVIRSNPRLKTVPVVVLTETDTDVETEYDRGANAYLSKPDDEDAYAAMIDSLAEFWFDCAQLPAEPLYADRS